MRRDSFEDDYEADDDDGDYEHEGEPTIDCPHCGEEIHEDAQQCPQCGTYLSEEDAPPQRKPLWIFITALVCLYIVYRWIVS